jgi:hypothetical protein
MGFEPTTAWTTTSRIPKISTSGDAGLSSRRPIHSTSPTKLATRSGPAIFAQVEELDRDVGADQAMTKRMCPKSRNS